jgi:hypothetical protein
MRNLALLASATTVFVLSLSAPGDAQANATIGVFFDAAGTQTTITVARQTPFEVYFVTDDIPVGISAYEFEVLYDPNILVLQRTAYPLSHLDVGPGSDNWIVGTGVCIQGPGPFVMVQYTCWLQQAATDVFIDVGPSSPSSFGGTAAGYVTCASQLLPFNDAYDGPALVNPSDNLGTNYCQTNPNSTGFAAHIYAFGSNVVADDNLSLGVSSLPLDRFGYFMVSTGQSFFANPGGSQGNLCLTSPIGRFGSQVQSSGAIGGFAIGVNLASIPNLGPVSAGETWNFQCWYRDINSNSNFSEGVEVTFQ